MAKFSITSFVYSQIRYLKTSDKLRDLYVNAS